MIDKKVSLIITTYNMEKYIEKAIKMVINQTIYESIQFIIVDGLSTDKTLDIIKKYKNKYNILLVKSKKNSSVSVARNKGLENAIGKYILFVDCDDYIEPKHTENLYKYAIKNDLDLLFFAYTLRPLNKTKSKKIKINYPKDIKLNNIMALKELLHQKNGIKAYNCMKIFKNDIVKKYNVKYYEKAYTVEDALFFIQYVYYCTKIDYINEYSYHYIKRLGSLSNKIDEQVVESFWVIINEIKKFLIEKNIYDENIDFWQSLYTTYYAILLNKIIVFKNSKKRKLELMEYVNKIFNPIFTIKKLTKELYNNEMIEKIIEIVIESKYDIEKTYKLLKLKIGK